MTEDLAYCAADLTVERRNLVAVDVVDVVVDVDVVVVVIILRIFPLGIYSVGVPGTKDGQQLGDGLIDGRLDGTASRRRLHRANQRSVDDDGADEQRRRCLRRRTALDGQGYLLRRDIQRPRPSVELAQVLERRVFKNLLYEIPWPPTVHRREMSLLLLVIYVVFDAVLVVNVVISLRLSGRQLPPERVEDDAAD